MKQPKTLEQIMGENNKKIKPSNKNNKTDSTKLTKREKHFIYNNPNKKISMNNIKGFAKNSAEFNKLVSYAFKQPALTKSDNISASHASNSDDSSDSSKKKYMSTFMHMSPSEMKQVLKAYHDTINSAKQNASSTDKSLSSKLFNYHLLWNSQINLVTLAKIDALNNCLGLKSRGRAMEYIMYSGKNLPTLAHENASKFYTNFHDFIKYNEPKAILQYDRNHSQNKIVSADKGYSSNNYRTRKPKNSKALDDKIEKASNKFADKLTAQLKDKNEQLYQAQHSTSQQSTLVNKETQHE